MANSEGTLPKYMQKICDDCGNSVPKNKPIRIWSDAEDRDLKRLYPDFHAIELALSHRKIYCCIERCYELRLHLPSKHWSELEIEIIRKIYSNSSREKITYALPGRTWAAIKMQAFKLNLHRQSPHRPIKKTGFRIVDDLFEKARSLKFSLADLDAEGEVPGYFSQFMPSPFVRIDAFEKALKAMGGQLYIRWSEG